MAASGRNQAVNPATIEEPAVNQERSQADRRTQAGERSQVSGAPWRRCGSQIAHEGFQATSAPGQEGYAGPSARAAITASVPAASYRLVPNILHHSASQRTYNSRICIAWPSLNTAGESIDAPEISSEHDSIGNLECRPGGKCHHANGHGSE